MLKFLHKFYNKANLSWVYLTWTCHYKNGKAPHERHSVGSFWWRDIMSLVEHYMMIASCKVNKGDTLCIWSDLWECGVLQWRFPQLHSFSKTRGISVAKFLSNQLERNFWVPLSTQASSQLIDFQNLITSIQRQNSENDIWSYIWGNPILTSKKSYVQLQGTLPASPLFACLWKSQVQNKTKFFFWLFLRDRCLTPGTY